MTYWKETSKLLILLPEGDNPNDPFKTKAGENDVICHKAGYAPASKPVRAARTPVPINKGMLASNESSPLIISANQVLAIPLTINKERMKENRQIATASTNMAQRNVLSDPPRTFLCIDTSDTHGNKCIAEIRKINPGNDNDQYSDGKQHEYHRFITFVFL